MQARRPASTPRPNDVDRSWDDRREASPLNPDERLGWVITRHGEITRVLHDPVRFSNQVSHHLSVPNGMDPPEHTPYRKLIDSYFCRERMQVFEPVCRGIAADLVRRAVAHGPDVEVQSALGFPFAARVQCRFLGWPEAMEQALLDWAVRNLRAIHDLDRPALAKNARRFEELIEGQLLIRREAKAGPETDLTARLMLEQVNGRGLRDEEIVSILRNWTAGEVGTISASVGILAHFFATHGDIQAALRDKPERIPYAIEETLRIHGPLLTNRRKTTCPVHIGGTDIPPGEPVTIHWPSGNRDPRAFDNPLTFRWDRDHKDSLLYGAGIHVCPGAPLARLEMRLLVEQLLCQTRWITEKPDRSPVPADFPLGGYAAAWISVSHHPADHA